MAGLAWSLFCPVLATEYFAGPFNSWLNVQTGYGATGNGTTDDTVAIQNALNAASASHSVVYLPAGTYKISAPLTVQNLYGFSFIGASPTNTTIVWAGPSGGTMMWVLATGSSSWGRITWEGSGTAGIGVGTSCTNGSCSAGAPPTFNHHFDEVFQDMGKGIAGGVSQVGLNSEMTISRCAFNNCSYAGLSVESYNALDYWVWDCTFLDCARGLTNDVSGGNFMAYRCFFQNSSIADLKITNAEFFSARDNVSIGSHQFINAQGNNSAVEISAQGNRVVNTTNPTAIFLNNLGPALLVDNQIQSQSGATAAAVSLLTPNGSTVGGPDLVSIGNQYTVSNPITVIGQILAPSQSVRWWTQEDQVVSYGSISSSAPTMPPLPTQLNTNITDLLVGSSAASIQAAINAVTGSNPVIHLPAGSYALTQGVTIPANLNLIITGDGVRTNVGSATTGKTLFLLNGPSKATLENFALGGNHGTGILVQNADQTGARVFGEGLYMSTNYTTDVLADTLANTQVVLQGFEALRGGLVSVKSIGTGSAAVSSLVGIYGGATSDSGGVGPTNGWIYEVSNQGRMLVQDAWYESGQSPTVVNLQNGDSGVLSFWGGNMGSGSVGWSVILNGFNGLAAFLDLNYGIQNGGGIFVAPSNNTQALFLGDVANQPNYFESPVPGGGAGVVSGANVFFDDCQGQTVTGSTRPIQVPDQPANSLSSPNPPAYPVSFIDNMLNLTRTEPDLPIADLPSGVTDARFYRLYVSSCAIGLDVTSNSVVPTPVPTIAAATPTAVSQNKSYSYPQPAQNQMTIVYPSGSAQQVRVNIYAFSGEEVDTFTANAVTGNNNQTILSVQTFAPGVYFYMIHGLSSGEVEAKGKFLVAR